jgi:hypothetical protein
MSALLLVLLAVTVAGWAGARAHTYHRDRRDAAEADETVRWLRSMRPDPGFDEHCASALYAVADDLQRRRIDQAAHRHPAGRHPNE